MTPGIEWWYTRDESKVRQGQSQAVDQAQAIASSIIDQRRDWGHRNIPQRTFQQNINVTADFVRAAVKFMESINLDAFSFDGVLRQVIDRVQKEYEAEQSVLVSGQQLPPTS